MLKLYVGNKNYSSWSMRPWVAMKQADIAFEEVYVRFDSFSADSQFKQRMSGINPAGKVPVLQDGDLSIWDTLAISEYLAETFPEKNLWPADKANRARARQQRHCEQRRWRWRSLALSAPQAWWMPTGEAPHPAGDCKMLYTQRENCNKMRGRTPGNPTGPKGSAQEWRTVCAPRGAQWEIWGPAAMHSLYAVKKREYDNQVSPPASLSVHADALRGVCHGAGGRLCFCPLRQPLERRDRMELDVIDPRRARGRAARGQSLAPLTRSSSRR
jgi:hypothetical protein